MSFLVKLSQNFKTSEHFVGRTLQGTTFNNTFTIRHYAGDVVYSPAGMLDKNRDTLFRDILVLLSRSVSPFISYLFDVPLLDTSSAVAAAVGKRPVTAASTFRRQVLQPTLLLLGLALVHVCPHETPRMHRLARTNGGDVVGHALVYRVEAPVLDRLDPHLQMGELMSTLRRCLPHYVRTIKPNDAKRPRIFDPELVRLQVVIYRPHTAP